MVSRGLPFASEDFATHTLLRLTSPDNTNRLTLETVRELTFEIEELARASAPKPLIITGNHHFFSAGADLNRGETLMITNCAPCHAVGRTGDSPRADAPTFRTLSKKYPIETLAESLAEGLFTGHPDMP